MGGNKKIKFLVFSEKRLIFQRIRRCYKIKFDQKVKGSETKNGAKRKIPAENEKLAVTYPVINICVYIPLRRNFLTNICN